MTAYRIEQVEAKAQNKTLNPKNKYKPNYNLDITIYSADVIQHALNIFILC